MSSQSDKAPSDSGSNSTIERLAARDGQRGAGRKMMQPPVVHTQEPVSRAVASPVSETDVRRLLATRFEYPAATGPTVHPDLVAAHSPYSAKGRMLRALAVRTFVRPGANQEPLVFSMAASERGVGSSYLAANLAVVFSQVGLNTLLMDGNTDHPHLHELFPDAVPFDGATHLNELPGFRSLTVVRAPSAKQQDAFPDLLAAHLRDLRARYHIIICDTPLYRRGRACESIAGICGNVMMVLRLNHSSMADARKLISVSEEIGTNILGCVLANH